MINQTPIDNHLKNKAVLIIGNDSPVIKSLITRLAHKGADVALICWQMKLDSIIWVKESVEETGSRFLLIEQSKAQGFDSKQLIDAITYEFGKLDAIIDMSSQSPQNKGEHRRREKDPWLKKPSWPITKVVLEAMA